MQKSEQFGLAKGLRWIIERDVLPPVRLSLQTVLFLSGNTKIPPAPGADARVQSGFRPIARISIAEKTEA